MSQPLDEGLPIQVIIENLSLFDPSENNMVQGSRYIQPGLPWHGYHL
jgi:hypothetical protein